MLSGLWTILNTRLPLAATSKATVEASVWRLCLLPVAGTLVFIVAVWF